MKIYNTMSKRKEEFVPLEEGKVKMYVCGPTVYNFIHIGNARPMIVFDTVRRYFEYKGYDVNYVSNFTDVDDKIIKRANEQGRTAAEVATEFSDKFIGVMRAAPRQLFSVCRTCSVAATKVIVMDMTAVPSCAGSVTLNRAGSNEFPPNVAGRNRLLTTR